MKLKMSRADLNPKLPNIDLTLRVDRKFGSLPFDRAFQALKADQNDLVDALFAVREKTKKAA